MSLNMTSDDEHDDDDDFDDAISLVHGISRGNVPKRKKEKGTNTTACIINDIAVC